MTRKTFAERADDSVRWTGVPTLVEAFWRQDDSQRRHLRILPLVALASAAAGTAAMLVWGRPQVIGPVLYLFGFLCAVWLPAFGPVKPWGSLRMDEYDRQIRRSAFLFAGAIANGFALCAFVLIGVWLREGATDRQLGYALALSGGWLMIFYGALPTLWASWVTRPLGDDSQ